MGRTSEYASKVKPYLKMISNWKRNGATDDQICEQLGISKSTFCLYKKKYSEFSDALKKSKAEFVHDLKGELARLAFKHELTTKKVYTTTGEDGKEKKHVEITTKEVDGDIAAIQILLKNLDKENGWADNPLQIELRQREHELKKLLAEAQNIDLDLSEV